MGIPNVFVDASPANVARIKTALGVLQDNAAVEIDTDDVQRYSVVRVADEVIVGLIGRACGVDSDDAARDQEHSLSRTS
jgi:hypothetical protein